MAGGMGSTERYLIDTERATLTATLHDLERQQTAAAPAVHPAYVIAGAAARPRRLRRRRGSISFRVCSPAPPMFSILWDDRKAGRSGYLAARANE